MRTRAAKRENVLSSMVGLSANVIKDIMEKLAVSYWKHVIKISLSFKFNAKL